MITNFRILLVRETPDACSQRWLVETAPLGYPEELELGDVICFQKVVGTIPPKNEFQRERELYSAGLGIVEKIFSSDDFGRDLTAMKRSLNWETQPHGHFNCWWKRQ